LKNHLPKSIEKSIPVNAGKSKPYCGAVEKLMLVKNHAPYAF
jgi:hypothetical protein